MYCQCWDYSSCESKSNERFYFGPFATFGVYNVLYMLLADWREVKVQGLESLKEF